MPKRKAHVSKEVAARIAQQPPPTEVAPPTTHEEFKWWHLPPTDIGEMASLLAKRAYKLKEQSEEGNHLRKLFVTLQKRYNDIKEEIKKEHPIAFFKPSYEQSLLLNAWWTGVDFPVCFAANRIGKTACFVINAILWIFPNNPAWEMFSASLSPSLSDDKHEPWIPNIRVLERYYLDTYERPVQILPRPSITDLAILKDILKRHPYLQGDPTKSHLEETNQKKFETLQKLFNVTQRAAWPSPPIVEDGTVWLGAPDYDFHRDIVMREWKRWLPQSAIKVWSKSELQFTISTESTTNPKTTEWMLLCKSYDSEDTKWSGAAVNGIVLTEGLSTHIFNEVRQRIKANGFGSWDYTPYEARNAGQKTSLAFKVYKGEEQLPLSSYIFTRFSARKAPSHILPATKRDDLIRMWEGKKEGAARLDGEFYSSSPLVLSRLDRKFHALQWSKEELFQRFPTGQIYRGFDPGYDHPTACVWGLLAPGNKWFIYRIYSERGRTLPERCIDIIQLSNNERRKLKSSGNQLLHEEVHPHPNSEVVLLTAGDFHLFKMDEQSGIPYVNNYHREGLLLTESTHMRPKDRAVELDRKLTKSDYLVHPETGKTPGASVYFLINEPGVDTALSKMEGLFWERLQSGPNKGEAKDEVPSHGDDELDALCYLVCGPYSHTNYQPKRKNSFLEAETEVGTGTYQQPQYAHNH